MHVDEDEARDLDLRTGDILDVLHKGLDAHLARFCQANAAAGEPWSATIAEASETSEDEAVLTTPAATGNGKAGRTTASGSAVARSSAPSPVLRAREA